MSRKKLCLPLLMLFGTVLDTTTTHGYLLQGAIPFHRHSFSPALSISSIDFSACRVGGNSHHSRLILQITSGKFNEEDLIVEDPPSLPSPAMTNNVDERTRGIPTEFFMQVGLVAILAFVGYNIATAVISGVVGMASSASHALGDEVGREMGQLGANVWALAVSLFLAVWEVLKVMVPFIGKGIMDAGKVAAPVVGEASSRFVEAASPYVNEAARVVNEAASPYVEDVARAVDESVVAPVKYAIDTNIMSPIQGAQNSVSSQINAIQSSVTTQIDSSLNEVGQTVTSTIQDATNQASASVREVVDAQTAKIVVPIQDITSKVDASVKSVVKPIQDAISF
ncbi:hypothetical protein IV203_015510 [Nitzschia inconspicua]|uniref:Uncharacterized protein n=1 Tax=Nitzschia inconspicua TaxID=303405 RepID=A0A9K3LDU7_9STRA|nr:hypothetical protein IV203_015510 [Nitzschia inconspicua]